MAVTLTSRASSLLCSVGRTGCGDRCGRSAAGGRPWPFVGGVIVEARRGGGGRGRLALPRRRRRSSLEFSGLKMSATEGLQKRVRDPQIAADESKSTAVKSKNYVGAQLSKPGVKSLLVAVAIPFALGSIDALFNSPSSQWFKDLKKPWWEPPGPIFGGAWSILYPLMGLASWLVWAEGGFHKQTTPLALYVAQLFLNLLWPMFFFGWKNLGLALLDILALVGTLGATINAFKSVNHVAANLMKPYLAWVLFATLLNFNLWYTNRGTAAHTEVSVQ